MARHPVLAFGLVALALLLTGPGVSTPAAAADPQEKGHPPETGVVHPAAANAAETAHAIQGHGAAVEPDILEPQPNLAIWTVVVFLGLLFVLGKFAWKPLLEALHHREEHLEHVLTETERARNESESLLAEHRRQLAAAQDEIRALFEEGRKNAQATADAIVKAAQAESEAAKQRAEQDIAGAKDQALSEIWSKTSDLAVSVAGKVLQKTLTEDDHRRLIDSAVGELNATTNGHGGSRS